MTDGAKSIRRCHGRELQVVSADPETVFRSSAPRSDNVQDRTSSSGCTMSSGSTTLASVAQLKRRSAG